MLIDLHTHTSQLSSCSGLTLNALSASIAQMYGLKGTGGGDVPALSEVGRFATHFECTVRLETDLAAELRAGRFMTVDMRKKG